jgi:tetratricopeptide (TPR) repeat protein
MKSVVQEILELKKSKKLGEALELAQQAYKKESSNPNIVYELADILYRIKRYDYSLELFTRLHNSAKKGKKPTDIRILVGIINNLISLDRSEEAQKIIMQIGTKADTYVEVLIAKSRCAYSLKEHETAVKLINIARKLEPSNAAGMHVHAQILIDKGDLDSAAVILEENICRPDFYNDSIDLWISVLEKQNKNRHAQKILKELSEKNPDVLEFVYGYAVLSNRAGELPVARKAFKKAMELSPKNYRVLYESGVLEKIVGNLEEAQELIRQSLDIYPDSPAALRTYGNDISYEYGDENFKRLNYVAAKFSEFKPLEQVHLHYALAKALDNVGETDSAFRHYQVGGSKKRKLDNFDETDAIHLNKTIQMAITPANLTATNLKGSDSDIPVFILGMPRSGTSLMEQILSAHPDVFGAGELKFLTGVLENIPVNQARIRMGDKEPVFNYDDKVGWAERGDAYVSKLQELAEKPFKRIVDKMPGNFNFVGLIHAILPNSKIIHSRRHPVETCLSCYRILFAEGHNWTYNLAELGRYYRRYWNLMEHWRKAFPGLMYEAFYEENVHDVEGSAKRLINFLGLDWDDNCLQFYNVDRPVKTASVTQVRKPIYTTSTNRWRRYEKYLGPLLEELGDIVPSYESQIEEIIKEKK